MFYLLPQFELYDKIFLLDEKLFYCTHITCTDLSKTPHTHTHRIENCLKDIDRPIKCRLQFIFQQNLLAALKVNKNKKKKHLKIMLKT